MFVKVLITAVKQCLVLHVFTEGRIIVGPTLLNQLLVFTLYSSGQRFTWIQNGQKKCNGDHVLLTCSYSETV